MLNPKAEAPDPKPLILLLPPIANLSLPVSSLLVLPKTKELVVVDLLSTPITWALAALALLREPTANA